MFPCNNPNLPKYVLYTLNSNILSPIKHKLELIHENMFVKKHVSM